MKEEVKLFLPVLSFHLHFFSSYLQWSAFVYNLACQIYQTVWRGFCSWNCQLVPSHSQSCMELLAGKPMQRRQMQFMDSGLTFTRVTMWLGYFLTTNLKSCSIKKKSLITMKKQNLKSKKSTTATATTTTLPTSVWV